MTVAELTDGFLMNLGYSRSDLMQEDVVQEYADVLLRYLNEGYARAVCRLYGREAVGHLDPLRCEEDEPVKLDESLHPLLADYAAARVQEIRGNTASSGTLYAVFERGLAENAADGRTGWHEWENL